MEKTLVLMVLVIFTIIILSNTVRYFNRKKRLDSFCLFSLSYLIYYYIIPILVLILPMVDANIRFSFNIFNASFEQHLFAVLISALGYAFFYISFGFFKKIKTKDRNDIDTKDYFEEVIGFKKYKLIILIGSIMFIITFFAEIYLAYKLGGILNSLSLIEPIRTGAVNESDFVPSNMLFLFTIYPWIHTSTFLYFLAYRIKKTKLNFLIFIVSMCCSIYALLLSGGRIQIVIFLMCFFYDYFKKNYKHYFFAMGLIIVIILISLIAMDNLFFYFSFGFTPEWNSTSLSTIIEEFAFPYSNLINVTFINEKYGLRYGIDFISWITYLAPSPVLSLIGIRRIEHGFLLISEFYNGVNSVRGTVPTDLLTLGYRQFGMLGVFIMSFNCAVISVIIEKLVNRIKNDKYTFLYIRICMLMFIIIPYADIENFMRNNFSILILMIVVSLVFQKDN